MESGLSGLTIYGKMASVLTVTQIRALSHTILDMYGCSNSATWEENPTLKRGHVYHGLLVHDLRRSAVRNLIRAGVSETVAMKISSHETRDVFERYNITSTKDIHEAAAAVERDNERLMKVGGRKAAKLQ